MIPGDQVTKPLTVFNNGNLPLRYALVSAATNNDGKNLMSQLKLTIKSGVTTCTNAGFSVNGQTLYGPAALGSLSGLNVIGNPAQGFQSGDRALLPGANETLCLNVGLTVSAGNEFQNAATTATFFFFAEDTTNNP